MLYTYHFSDLIEEERSTFATWAMLLQNHLLIKINKLHVDTHT